MTKCVILAGGLGTRLRSMVSDVPKPMADICGKPFLSHLMKFYINNLTKVEFIISIGYKGEKIKNYFGSEFCGSSISYAEEFKPLGTGGALLKIMNELEFKEEPFLLVNGDSYIDYNFQNMCQTHLTNGADVTVCAMRANENDRYGGIELNKQSTQVMRFRSEKGKKGDLANAGVYLISPTKVFHECLALNKNKFSFEADFLSDFVHVSCVRAYETKGYFIDIGIPGDYVKAKEHFAMRLN